MKWLMAIAFALALNRVAEARVGPVAVATARSRSGQLLVCVSRGAGQQALQLTNLNLVYLEPTLVAISGERIKQLLGRELDATAPWRGKIFLTLYPARDIGEPVTITSERFADGWQYRVDMPDLIERVRYVRALVQALLLEMANRDAHARSTEVPTWLVEGFTQQLLASSQIQIILSPPPPGTNGLSLATTEVNGQKENPLKHAHEILNVQPALTFEELSWWAQGAESDRYCASAQVFVQSLLHLPNGPVCLRSMISDLAQYFNWQFAFLRAFQDHFARPIDTEKWWALQVTHFLGRDLAETWDPAESWQRFARALHSTVEGRGGANELPHPVEVTLQNIIREWSSPAQKSALQDKVVELGSLRLRMAREYVELVDAYRQTLETYLHQHGGLSFILPFRKEAAQRHLTETTLKQLDELDRRREALRPRPNQSTATQASALPAKTP
jgi:hypothetical protein